MKRTLYLDRDGLRLRAEYWCPEQASVATSVDTPLALLVHGFPDTPHGWFGVAEQLVGAGFCVLMPWLRGYTAESARYEAAYDLIRCADDLVAWCLHVEHAQVHLVGHDWGAVLAQLAAHHDADGTSPVRWQSISLLAIPAFYPLLRSTHALPALPKQLALSRYMAHLQSAHSWRWVSAAQAAWVEKTWQRWSPTWAFSPDDIAPARNALSQPEIAWAATRYYRALFTPWQASTREVYARMSRRIEQPLLLLAGSEDGCMHADFHRRLARGLSAHHHAHVIEQAGHFVQAEQPRRVGDYLLSFMARAVGEKGTCDS